LAKFLTKKALKSLENEANRTIVIYMDVWNHIVFMCKNYILNELDNTLYDVYSSIKSAKVL
jgi:hypothetical protein